MKKTKPHKSRKKKPKDQATQRVQPTNEGSSLTGWGILPDRDLKKNLGCG
jgi:hypothetical protein